MRPDLAELAARAAETGQCPGCGASLAEAHESPTLPRAMTDMLLVIARRALTALATLSFVAIGFAGAVGWSDGFIAWAAILTMVTSVGLLAVSEEQSIRRFNRGQEP